MIGREITTNGCLGNGFSEMNMARYGRMDTGGEPPKATFGSRATGSEAAWPLRWAPA